MKNFYVLSIVLLFLIFMFTAYSQDLVPKKNAKGKYGFVDNRDSVKIPYQFEDADNFFEGLAAVKSEGKWGFIDKTGKTVISCQFDMAYYFSEGVCPVRKNNKWFYINKKAKRAIDNYFQMAFSYSEGVAAVKTETGWGYLDKDGSFDIKPEYEEAASFSEGLAAVKDGGVWGYINSQAETVIEFKYDEAHNFKNGLAYVKLNGKMFQIDKTGKKYVPVKDEQKEDANMVYTTVDQRPEFPGGHDEYIRFINNNLQYPAEEKQNKIEGLIIVSLIITKDGDFKELKVVQGDNVNFKNEALRVLQLMPKWTPGKLNGKPVNVQTTVPVRFRFNTK